MLDLHYLDFIEKLKKEFPLIYSAAISKKNGFIDLSIPRGWRYIIYDMSKALEQELNDAPQSVQENTFILQIKPRRGELRVDMTVRTNAISSIIDAAVIATSKMCQYCGTGSDLRISTYKAVLCRKHIDANDLI